MLKVLGLGDNVCDLYLHTKMMYPGGQALNFSVFASRLGVHAEYLGAFGSDPVAEQVKQALDDLGVPHPRCREYDAENGYAKVTLVEGDRVFMGSNRGGPIQQHPIVLDQDDLNYLSGFDLVHTSNNSFLDGELPKLGPLPCLISYDFSYRWTEEDRVKRVCPHADFAFLSCSGKTLEEAKEICTRLHNEGCGIVVATMGKEGAAIFDGELFLHRPADSTPAIDTLGAGDSYATAVLITILRAQKANSAQAWKGRELREATYRQALKNATQFATEICQLDGAFGHGAPIPQEVAHLVFNRREENAP